MPVQGIGLEQRGCLCECHPMKELKGVVRASAGWVFLFVSVNVAVFYAAFANAIGLTNLLLAVLVVTVIGVVRFGFTAPFSVPVRVLWLSLLALYVVFVGGNMVLF